MSDNEQRDELADEIAGHPIGSGYESTSVGMDEARDIADTILAAGYRKPRTITTVEELSCADTAELLLAARINEAMEEWDAAQPGTVAAHIAAHVAARLAKAGYGKPRTIMAVEELDALPDGAVVRSCFGELLELGDGLWYFGGDGGERPSFPATVIHEPTTEATQ